LGLFWQIVVFLVVAAALGFVIGWVVRGARLERERPAVAPRQSSAEAGLEDERDRLQTELQAAGAAHGELEASLAESQRLADARAGRVHELEAAEASSRQRIAELEDELGKARAVERDPGTAFARNGAPPAESRPTADPIPNAPPADVMAGAPPAEPRPPADPIPVAPPAAVMAGAPPQALAAPEGEPDDLKLISGIGPGIEKVLHELGIYHFHQIAQFTPDNVAWVNQRLRFRGRIEREDWIDQARKLAAGETVDRA
jgi:NADH-quinone oxidoreductase subunit E